MLNNDRIKIDLDNGEQYSYFLYPYSSNFRNQFTSIKNQSPNTFFDFQDIFGVKKSKEIDKATDFVRNLVRELEYFKVKSVLLQEQLNEQQHQDCSKLVDQDISFILNDPKCESDAYQQEQILNNDDAFKEKYGFVPSSKTLSGKKKKKGVMGIAEKYKCDHINGFYVETLDDNLSADYDYKVAFYHKKFNWVSIRFHTLDEAFKAHEDWVQFIKNNDYKTIVKRLSVETGVKI